MVGIYRDTPGWFHCEYSSGRNGDVNVKRSITYMTRFKLPGQYFTRDLSPGDKVFCIRTSDKKKITLLRFADPSEPLYQLFAEGKHTSFRMYATPINLDMPHVVISIWGWKLGIKPKRTVIMFNAPFDALGFRFIAKVTPDAYDQLMHIKSEEEWRHLFRITHPWNRDSLVGSEATLTIVINGRDEIMMFYQLGADSSYLRVARENEVTEIDKGEWSAAMDTSSIWFPADLTLIEKVGSDALIEEPVSEGQGMYYWVPTSGQFVKVDGMRETFIIHDYDDLKDEFILILADSTRRGRRARSIEIDDGRGRGPSRAERFQDMNADQYSVRGSRLKPMVLKHRL